MCMNIQQALFGNADNSLTVQLQQEQKFCVMNKVQIYNLLCPLEAFDCDQYQLC